MCMPSFNEALRTTREAYHSFIRVCVLFSLCRDLPRSLFEFVSLALLRVGWPVMCDIYDDTNNTDRIKCLLFSLMHSVILDYLPHTPYRTHDARVPNSGHKHESIANTTNWASLLPVNGLAECARKHTCSTREKSSVCSAYTCSIRNTFYTYAPCTCFIQITNSFEAHYSRRR